MNQNAAPLNANILLRTKIWFAIIFAVIAIFIIRLFYLQVIQHANYKQQALIGQLKEYEIEPTRGTIYAMNGSEKVPIVLNEPRFTLFADPLFIKDSNSAAEQIEKQIGGNVTEYKEKMEADSRYQILAKKLTADQAESINNLELKGVGTREVSIRIYPQGTLSSQVLGFVNDENIGKYGIEEFYNEELRGKPGRLKAITDANGVPLVANEDNVIEKPEDGSDVVLTIDIPLQSQVEEIIKKHVKKTKANTGSAIVIDVNTGAVKAMANYPTYDPAKYYEVEDGNLFNNNAVSYPTEVGSIMKPLTTAAALEYGDVTKTSGYFDPGFFIVDDAKISNVEEIGGAAQRTVPDILSMSLNTGATWLLMQMGGGEINQKARQKWYDFMTKHYRFGQETGIEQGFESPGKIPDPNEGYGLNITYANTAFGQASLITPIQIAAADSAILNGGTYYRPRLVENTISSSGEEKEIGPEVLLDDVVGDNVSKDIQDMMENVVTINYIAYGFDSLPENYRIGGKSGTAEVAKPEGGYYTDRFNGTYTGWVGGDKPQYLVVVSLDKPVVQGYAGSRAAAPVFVDISQILINNFNVRPRS
ncbi:MAG: penicillin-binding protein 2 [bacterium]|nr:penicillin-binding protein 2 [bacterium]